MEAFAGDTMIKYTPRVNFLDISKYISAYMNSDQIADMDRDNDLDVDDIFSFIDAMNQGCP